MSQEESESDSKLPLRPRKRKLRSIADPRSLNNYLGSFKAELILGNIPSITNGEILFSLKESKWNFINENKQVNTFIQLDNSQKLKKDDVTVNLIDELTKNHCNQDVLVYYGSSREKKYCLLRHKFSEMWRFPIYCNFLDLKVEVNDDEEEYVENRLYSYINKEMQKDMQEEKDMESTFMADLLSGKDNQQKMSTEEILSINKFRSVMKTSLANASKVKCNVHVYLKQHFYTFPLNIPRGVLERGCQNFPNCSFNEQLELLSKDSLYLLFDLLNITKQNKLDIPLSKKVPIMSQYYKHKLRKNILDSQRMDIVLHENKSENEQKESEINSLFSNEYLDSIDDSFSFDLNPRKVDKIRRSQSNDNLHIGEHDEEDDDEMDALQEYDDKNEEELIYENEEQDGDTTQEDRSNIEEGKNFKKTITPTQMDKQFELKEYQQQGLTWMLHREQKISKKKLYEQKWQILESNNGTQYKDITMAYEHYFVENAQNDEVIQFYYNPLNGHSCLDLEFEEDEEPIMGGILADQMGLGKTIQAIALLLSAKFKDYQNEPGTNKTNAPKHQSTKKFYLNQDDSYRASEDGDDGDTEDQYSQDGNGQEEEENAEPQSDMTLIVAPKSLVSQWEVEIQSALKDIESFQIYRYEKGVKYKKNKKLFRGIDIVITTYGILAAEYKNLSKIATNNE